MVAIATVVLILGLFFIIAPTTQEEKKANPDEQTAPITSTVKAPNKEGSKPTQTRLRDGAKQIDNKQEALAIARESLDRIEKEIAGAKTEQEREAMERKKALIERTIGRFEQ